MGKKIAMDGSKRVLSAIDLGSS